ncbi:MAG: DUF917 domain-containing protein [Bifidobacteriaceae bacterium]|jgi:DUF917 family protein|nr:DUF917 domain-containing protein [Bifidobacteriaceae bacterium]
MTAVEPAGERYAALTAWNLPAFEIGAEILGSGGGGAPTAMALVLADLLRERDLPLIANAPDGTFASAIGAMGGPSIFAECLPSGEEYRTALGELEGLGLPRPEFVLCVEAAGMNGSYGAYLALHEGLGLLDGDLMGRALPRLEQTSLPSVPSMGPFVLVPPTGEVLLVDRAAPRGVERIMRAALPQCGGWGLFVTRPLSGPELGHCMIPGTVSRAIYLGVALRRTSAYARGPEMAEAIGGRLLGSGALEEIARYPSGGPNAGGNVHLRDTEGGFQVRLEFQNEYLLAAVDGEVVATCPDLLIVVDPRVRRFVRPEELRPRLDVAVIALPGPSWWKQTPARLGLVGPRAFGIEHDYVDWVAAS